MVLGGIILRKYSKFTSYDIFGIRKQIETIIRTLCVLLFLNVLLDGVIKLAGREDLLCFWVAGMVVLMSSITYLEVFYVIKQNEKSNNNLAVHMCFCVKSKINDLNTNMSKHNCDQNQLQTSPKESTAINGNYKQSIQNMGHWSQVVSTSIGYELFINHLESEFSVENMLFITEVR